MTLIYDFIKKIARLVTIIGLFVAGGFTFFMGVAGIGGQFFPVLGRIILLIFIVALYILPAILLLLNRLDAAKIAFLFLGLYWLVGSAIDHINASVFINTNARAYFVVVSIFEVIVGLGLATIVLLFLLSKVFGLKLMNLCKIVLICTLFAFALYFTLAFIDNIVSKDGWADYFNTVVDALILPCAVISGFILLFDDNKETAE